MARVRRVLNGKALCHCLQIIYDLSIALEKLEVRHSPFAHAMHFKRLLVTQKTYAIPMACFGGSSQL